MTVLTDADLFLRGTKTLVASWEEYARGAADAVVLRLPGVAAAVFPNDPERTVYNNALLKHDLTAVERSEAIVSMEAAYAPAGVTRFAAWVHESDAAMRAELERHGYKLDTSTRAMGMSLDDIRLPRPDLELAPIDWFEYLRIVGVPSNFLSAADPGAYHILLARLNDENVGTAMAFDRDGDCGIYNVGTLEHARRRGVGTGLTALQVHNARTRGCRTASLQSTKIAERVYAAVGFRDLGRLLEYAPPEMPRARRALPQAPVGARSAIAFRVDDPSSSAGKLGKIVQWRGHEQETIREAAKAADTRTW
jgi:GNAT superfamily N-acetyltransferase